MDDKREVVFTELKAVILCQQATRGGRRDGGICLAVEVKVVCDGTFGDTG